MSQKQIRPGEGTPADKPGNMKVGDDPVLAKKAREARELLAKMEADKKARAGGGGGGNRGCCGCC